MLIDEQVLTFAEATTRLPRLGGRKIHTSSIWRWATKGVRGVRLEARLLGGRYVTSLEALDRFAATLVRNRQVQGNPPVTSSKSQTQPSHRRSVAAAAETLSRANI